MHSTYYVVYIEEYTTPRFFLAALFL